jgi:hypothetical protein
MTQSQFQFDDSGRGRRNKGIKRVKSQTPDWWLQGFSRALFVLKAKGKPFTAEDIRELTGDPPNHPNAMGAAVNSAVRSGQIQLVGYERAKRKEAQARLIRSFI